MRTALVGVTLATIVLQTARFLCFVVECSSRIKSSERYERRLVLIFRWLVSLVSVFSVLVVRYLESENRELKVWIMKISSRTAFQRSAVTIYDLIKIPS